MDKFRLMPPQASTSAHQIDWLFIPRVAIMLFFLISVFFPITWFAIKYRSGSDANRSNASHSSNMIEIGWTTLPIVLSVALFSWGAVAYYHMERPPANALQVQVVGKQWMWKLQHAEGKREINELHVPLGQTVRLTMTSQDVIHSFFIPAFRVKQDVVPGRYTTEWFKPTKLGEYHLFCAEFCGTMHSRMIGRVVVMEPNEYEKWLTVGDVGDPVVVAGRRLFTQLGCSGCHENSTTIRAPRLEGIFGKPVPLASGEVVVADERYIRDSVLMPQAQIAA